MTWSRIGLPLVVASALLVGPTTRGQSSSVAGAPGHQGAASLHGAIRDSQNRAVLDATVYLQATSGTQSVVAHTDSEGNYRFSELKGGNYSLRAEKSGLGNAELSSFSLGATEAKQVDLMLGTQKAAGPQPANTKPAFFDEPTFTVSGVTDSTYLGGHGSGGNLRSAETLVKSTAKLGRTSTGSSVTASSAAALEKS